ncbi:unnamed protein product, partial [Discosporangium mesarthrocarpum]
SLELEGEATRRGKEYFEGTSGKWNAVANYVNTIVGAGVIALPYAIKQSGLWTGIILMFLSAYLLDRAAIILVVSGVKVKRLNYEELMAAMFGNAGLHAFCFFAFVVAFGAMCAYLIVIGDTIPEIALASGATSTAFTDRAAVILVFAIFFILPLAALKDLKKLSYSSFLSILADALLICIVVFTGPAASRSVEDIDRSQVGAFIRPTLFNGLGTISFAYVSHSSSFLLYRSLKKQDVEAWTSVTDTSISISWFMGIVLALAGYLSFANTTQGDILNNFSTEHGSASVARGFLAVTMVFTYPMEMYVARHVLDASIFQTFLGFGPMTSTRHYGITLVLWVATLTVALSTRELGDVLQLSGSLGSSVRKPLL